MSLLRVQTAGIVAAENQSTSSFAPGSVGTVELWFDASVGSSIHATGGAVDTWDDLSGNARHATASSTARPTTGTRTLNSLNVLDFDGVNDTMVTSSFSVSSVPFSMAMVVLSDAGANSATEFVVHDVTSNRGLHKRPNNQWALSCGNERFNTGVTVDTTARGMVGVCVNPGSSSVLRIGTNETNSGNSGTGTLAGGINLGGFNGIIAEVLIWSTELDGTNRALVTSYFTNKWAV